MNLPSECPIKNLKSGEMAVVEEIECTCEEEIHRLASMGFSAGALVRMLMPGCPCAVQVGDCRVMLRGFQTEAIRVVPV